MLKLLIIFNILTFTPHTVPSEVGNYPVKIEYKDGEVTKTKVIQLTILSKNTIVEEGIAIDAHDFTIGEDATLSKDLIVTLSNGQAWNTSTGENYDIDRTEVMKINDTLYKATLYSFDNINTTINIYVEKDYYQTLPLTEKISNVFDKPLEEYYAFQLIVYVLLLLLLLLLIIILVSRYNAMITKTTKDFKQTKDDVKKD